MHVMNCLHFYFFRSLTKYECQILCEVFEGMSEGDSVVLMLMLLLFEFNLSMEFYRNI